MSTTNDYQKEEESLARPSLPINPNARITMNDTRFPTNSLSVDVNKDVLQFKVVLLGNVAVGKTSILSRFAENSYKKDYKCNVGVEFKVKSVLVDQNTIADLKIWDTCGDEKYKGITMQYYRDADGILLVFDLTQRETFEKLPDWVKDIKETAARDPVTMIVGNKLDIIDGRKVTNSEGMILAQKNEMEYIEVSAKTGSNVYLIFEKLAAQLVKKADKAENNPILSYKLMKKGDQYRETKTGCC